MGSKGSKPQEKQKGEWKITYTYDGKPMLSYKVYMPNHTPYLRGNEESNWITATPPPNEMEPPADLKKAFENALKNYKQQQEQKKPPTQSINSIIIEKKNRISEIKKQIAGYEFNLTGCDNIRSLLESSRNELNKLIDELKQLETKGGSRKTRKNRKQKPHRVRTASRKR